MDALHLACYCGNLAVVWLLLQKGANPLVVIVDIGTSLIRSIYQRGFFVSHQSWYENIKYRGRYAGWTTLHCACGSNKQCLKVVQILLRRGANLLAVDVHGKFAFRCAIGKCYWETASLLLKNGFSIDAADGDGCSALHTASCDCNIDLAQFLLQHSANIYAVNRNGWTPLGYACNQGHWKMVQLVMKHDANFVATNNEGMLALLCASGVVHVNVNFALLCCNVHRWI
jgi:ankyrin repeat protein